MTNLVVGTFEQFGPAEDAIHALQLAGFAQHDISLVAGDVPRPSTVPIAEEASGVVAAAGAGASIGGAAGLLLGICALAIPGLGPILAAGPIAAAIGTAGVGAAAGGFLGAVTGIPDEDKEYYAETIRSGGAMVVLQTTADRASEAREVLERAGAAVKPPSEKQELSQSSEPRAAQLAMSGARIYEAGLEMNPRKSRFEDFTSPQPNVQR